MNGLVSIILLVFILFGCNNSKGKIADGFENVNAELLTKNLLVRNTEPGLDKRIIISELNKNSEIYLPDIIDTVYGISLDNHPDAIIGSIDKMRLTKDAIYLLDKYQTKALKKFDRNGNYISTIGKIGKGPGEYYEPTDFFVGENEIIIYDQFKRALNYYTLSGKFIKDKFLPFFFISFFVFDGNSIIFHTFDSDNYHLPKILNYSLLWTDSSFNIMSVNAFREKDKYDNLLSKNNMDCYNNKLYYHEPYNDTVFRVSSEGKIFYDYIFSFPKNQLPKSLLLKENSKKFIKAIDPNSSNNYAENWSNPIIANDYLYTRISLNSIVYAIFYSNNTNNIKLTSGTYNDTSTILFRPFSNILTCEGNTLVGYQEASELFNRFQSFQEPTTLDKNQIEFAKQVKNMDNPIIVFYKLKDF